MKLLFLHGWGFDATLWSAVVARLPDFDCQVADRGYFGARGDTGQDGPVIAVTHSFGTMLLLRDPPSACLGLVAIGGFDRFTSAPDRLGAPVRVLDRMIAKFAEEPRAVLFDFRTRCGDRSVFRDLNEDRLAEDLAALRDGDCRHAAATFDGPILSLGGALDQIVTPEMHAVQFEDAANVARMVEPGGGHMLPITHPGFCADQIRTFTESRQ